MIAPGALRGYEEVAEWDIFNRQLWDIYNRRPHPAANASGRECVRDRGLLSEYGSREQLIELQQWTPAMACDVYAIAYRHRAYPAEQRLLVLDAQSGTLYRFGRAASGGTAWERWSSVSPATLAADDPNDGIDAGRYDLGTGPLDLSGSVTTFLQAEDVPGRPR